MHFQYNADVQHLEPLSSGHQTDLGSQAATEQAAGGTSVEGWVIHLADGSTQTCSVQRLFGDRGGAKAGAPRSLRLPTCLRARRTPPRVTAGT